MQCSVIGCNHVNGLRTILVPFHDLQIAALVCYPCEIQIDERIAGSEDIYTPSSQEGAVTEKATKNVKAARVEDKNATETFDDADSEE